jgi:hypothetical protein
MLLIGSLLPVENASLGCMSTLHLTNHTLTLAKMGGAVNDRC